MRKENHRSQIKAVLIVLAFLSQLVTCKKDGGMDSDTEGLLMYSLLPSNYSVTVYGGALSLTAGEEVTVEIFSGANCLSGNKLKTLVFIVPANGFANTLSGSLGLSGVYSTKAYESANTSNTTACSTANIYQGRSLSCTVTGAIFCS
ncbi:hypothetical protein EHQ52_14935 [Leptospira koniambonensis]|uniref:Uncharacterized protein n=1 Tax=Leptospira koniambonensis TaxID=2484950 RepID=A0A4V3JN34_9LEPT|nr:hypothetical protein [Leptospira koniambonensis]TGL32575.1 hypothetical protein EHQ52_14935 [Leptospira koniambonensis]